MRHARAADTIGAWRSRILPTSTAARSCDPPVTLFGEPIPARPEHDAKRALRECDLFVAIGKSGVVLPAAGFVHSAAYVGARTAYVNVEPLDADAGFGEAFIGQAEALVPALFGRTRTFSSRPPSASASTATSAASPGGDVVAGEGDWDLPGDWRSFVVEASSGRVVPGHA